MKTRTYTNISDTLLGKQLLAAGNKLRNSQEDDLAILYACIANKTNPGYLGPLDNVQPENDWLDAFDEAVQYYELMKSLRAYFASLGNHSL